jgi:tetratricopeptide (TPR) repeat protein
MAQRTDEGIVHEREALRIQPKYTLAMYNLSLAYLSKKDFARARFWLREALDIAPDDAQLKALQTRMRLAGVWAGVRKIFSKY